MAYKVIYRQPHTGSRTTYVRAGYLAALESVVTEAKAVGGEFGPREVGPGPKLNEFYLEPPNGEGTYVISIEKMRGHEEEAHQAMAQLNAELAANQGAINEVLKETP